MSPVEVTWLDHVGHGPAWVSLEDVDHGMATFKSVGYLIAISRNSITIASTLEPEGDITGDTTVLVRACLTEIRYLT